ncbi:hypothetical protein [Ktedonobacter racemifer]|uniref:hypothetical protein n=1 Tax=Ktedonobacter racemifer TaxID=363277 RepID=UPI00030FB392|nr:hypothetical protein [Ktedonobacter racemifer]
MNDGQRWALGIDVTINTLPSEIKTPIPCDQDEVHQVREYYAIVSLAAREVNPFW